MPKAQVFIDHLTIPVRDPEASRRFYRQALAPFGVEEVELEGGVGWGPPGRVDFFIRQGEPTAQLHLAFAAPDRATVDAFHAAALAAGGTDNGAPGLRPRYHESYYGGYVIDLDGHNVEAVFHGRPASPPLPESRS
jgi:catechol 2,3-dioxygenase-like lactoylglutathione lyase family enzyme